MIESIYTILGTIEVFIFLLLIARFIFFEKGFQSKSGWIRFFCVFLVTQILGMFIDKGEMISIFLPFLFLVVYIIANREKHRIRGIFLLFPIVGIMFSIPTIMISFAYLFFNHRSMITENIEFVDIWMDAICMVFLMILFLKRKTWKKQYGELIENRVLEKWEKFIICFVGLFLLMLAILVLCVDELNLSSIYATVFVILGMMMMLLLLIAIAAIILQGNGKFYFQNTAKMNEYYLEAQLKHFRTYQEAQKETRRMKHDMKNHISCIYYLMKDKKYERAETYIEEIHTELQEIDKEIHCGNDIIDAIINEKYAVAAKQNIRIVCDGYTGTLKIRPIDLCSIVANAIDNAIEALDTKSIEDKVIKIEIKRHESIIYFTFVNEIESENNRIPDLRTKKRDTMNHGFGLKNINRVVQFYNGQVRYEVKFMGEKYFFVLEVMLFEN